MRVELKRSETDGAERVTLLVACLAVKPSRSLVLRIGRAA